MRAAILTHNARAGDAIGNQVAEKVSFFLDHEADVRVFLESADHLHPAVHGRIRQCPAGELADDDQSYLDSADLIIVEYGHFYPLLLRLPLVSGKGRILFDYHGVTPAETWAGPGRELLDAAARRRGLAWCADAVLAHSRFALWELREATGFPAGHCHVLNHPVDVGRFGDEVPHKDLRKELGLGPDSRLLLFVGRLAPNKRVSVLAEALALLREQVPAVHAVVVGDIGDVYRAEADRCQERARELGVDDRLHLLGHVGDDRLRDAYRSADVFVMPSVHEGFCIPVVEALASGLPVVVARAGALPETMGEAGLTFQPDDAEDLASQVLRVLNAPGSWVVPAARELSTQYSVLSTQYSVPGVLARPRCVKVAVVSGRWGNGFVGGAESALRTTALALSAEGHHVEVFTTCAAAETNWKNDYSEGSREADGLLVHRFAVDTYDSEAFHHALRTIECAGGDVPAEVEEEFARHSLHSSGLMEALRRRVWDFDALLVGPYGNGLARQVAGEFPEKTLLLSCFHDEATARLPGLRKIYSRIAGLLFLTPEEQHLAQAELGINTPGNRLLGMYQPPPPAGNGGRGRNQVGLGCRYLLYAGRYVAEKGLLRLLEYARRYSEERPGRFAFVFIGQGSVPVPKADWARDLGFVGEEAKHDLIAGTDAMVHLSANESLSLAALEAWGQGTPVVADSRCPVLVGHLERSGGGRAVATYEDFARVLDDLWENPAAWREAGWRGREYVRAEFGDRTRFVGRLVQAVRAIPEALADKMRRRGLERAAGFGRDEWRRRFAALVEQLLHQPRRERRNGLEIRPRQEEQVVRPEAGTVMAAVEVTNRGTVPALADGPARWSVQAQVVDALDEKPLAESTACLPDLLAPGQSATVVVPVAVPPGARLFDLSFRLIRAALDPNAAPACRMRLRVDANATPSSSWCAPFLESARRALADAHACQRLPDDYADVSLGWFAAAKRWLKAKLLGNFKRAYVDVLSRQQTEFNQRVLTALRELIDCCAALENAQSAILGQLNRETAVGTEQKRKRRRKRKSQPGQ